MSFCSRRSPMRSRPCAITDYDRAVELAPDFAEGFCTRGYARCETGDLGGAIADGNRALDLRPTLFDGFAVRGMARARKGEVKPAMADLSRALDLAPTNGRLRPRMQKVLAQCRAARE